MIITAFVLSEDTEALEITEISFGIQKVARLNIEKIKPESATDEVMG